MQSALFLPHLGFSPYNYPVKSRNVRKNRKSKKVEKTAQKPADTGVGKRRRGRPGVRKSEVENRADDYRLTLEQDWNVLASTFLKAQSEEEFKKLLDEAPYHVRNKFAPIRFSLVEKMRADPKFPKTVKAQIRFIGDSLAALGRVAPRTSRDICAEGRKKKRHRIIRQDYYIECTCGYEGPAKHGACPGCGARAGILSPQVFQEPEDD